MRLARDPAVRSGTERKAKPVEQEIGDHDRRDQRQDDKRLPIGLEPCRLLHEAAEERIADCSQHRDFDPVLAEGERDAECARVHEALVVADHDQLQLPRQQGEEPGEDHRVHDPRLALAADHSRLQEAVFEQLLQPRARIVPADLRLQRDDDRQLAPRKIKESSERCQHQQRDSGGIHGADRAG